MHIGMAAFEYLPVRIGGLAEAVTSLAEALSKDDDVDLFMPSHGLAGKAAAGGAADLQRYADFRIIIGGRFHPVSVYQTRRRGVRIFLLSNEILDKTTVYHPRSLFMLKMIHFTKALPGLINLMIKHEGRKPDVIHVHDWHCVLAGALLKKYFRIPFIYTIHRLCRERISAQELGEVNLGELIEPRYLEGEMLDIEVFGAHQCDYLTTVSRSYLDEEWSSFFSSYQGKVTYVWNGADASFWDPQKLTNAALPRPERRRRLLEEEGFADGPFFFYVGRLDAAQKGIDTLLQAFEQLMGDEDGPADQLRLLLLGTGDPHLESEGQRFAARYPCRMKAVGRQLPREAVRELYGAADFCLIPSNFEPFGLVQLEAMCLGCIPIGSRVGGINDALIDLEENSSGATGLLVPKRNPGALAAAMRKAADMLESEPAAVRRIRRNGRRHVLENFTWERSAGRYRLLYRGMAPLKLPFVSYAEPY